MSIVIRLQQVVLSGIVFLGMLLPFFSHAGETDRLRGFAWSPNIGWLSFNCLNTNYCDTVDYGVNARGNGTVQSLSGWAWSAGGTDANGDYQEGLGWVNFDNATLNSATGELDGYALVHSTTISPYQSGESEDDGWDGVIDLAGTNGSINWDVKWDTVDNTADGYSWDDSRYNLFDGFAWGGLSVGWVSFSCQAAANKANTCGTVGYGVTIEPFYMEFNASKGNIQTDAVPYNGSFNHSWTVEPISSVSGCIGTNGPGTWSDTLTKPYSPAPTSETVTNNQNDGTSELSCSTGGSPNKTVTRSRYVHVASAQPITVLTADDTNIAFNSATVLRLDTQNVSSCVLDGGRFNNTPIPVINGNYATSTGPLNNASQTYLLDCESIEPINYPSGAQSSVTVFVERLDMDFYAVDENGDRLNQNELIAYTARGDINLRWDLEFASGGCTASASPATTQWSGSVASGDGQHDQTISDIDTGAFSFDLTCNGSNGQTETQSVSLKIGRNPTPSEEISDFLLDQN